MASLPRTTDDCWIDLSALSEGEQAEFKRLSDPRIVRGYGEFAAGELDARWIELYLKAAKARLGFPERE